MTRKIVEINDKFHSLPFKFLILFLSLCAVQNAWADVTISGTVFDEFGDPLPDIELQIIDGDAGSSCCTTLSAEDGSWAQALPENGTYYVSTTDQLPDYFIPLAWNQKLCVDCDIVATGDPIVVSNSDVGNIDFTIDTYKDDVIEFYPEKLSGSWYNPDRDGEGFHIEILENEQALVIWFTFPGDSDPAQSKQAWILGTGEVSGNFITIDNAFKVRGPVFGEGYNPDHRTTETWGDITIDFVDYESGFVAYDGKDGSGVTDIVRITGLIDAEEAGGLPPGVSGAWYNPETDGQGWFVEIISKTQALVYWFTYDENGNQAWNLGVGDIIDNAILLKESLAGRGTEFGAAFDADEVDRQPFSMISLNFTNCSSGNVIYSTAEGEQNGYLPIVRITDLEGAHCDNLSGAENVARTVMTNPSDPVVKRYETPAGTIFDLFGVYSNDGSNLTSNGALMLLPNGDNYRLTFDPDQKTYEGINLKTGTYLLLTENEEGNRLISISDPGLQQTVVIPITDTAEVPIQVSDTKRESKQNGAQLMGAEDVSDWGNEGPVAAITVEYCKKPTDKAKVEFILGDNTQDQLNPTKSGFISSQAITVEGYPFDKGGNQWVYESNLPSDLLNINGLLRDVLCNKEAYMFDNFCEVITETFGGARAFYAAACPYAGHPVLVAACVAILTGPVIACNVDKLPTDINPVCNNDLYRDTKPDLWARITMPGLNGGPWISTQGYIQSGGGVSTDAERIDLPKLVLPESPAILQHETSPTVVAAGSSFDLKVEVGCLNPGDTMIAGYYEGGEIETCNIDSSNWCTFKNLPTEVNLKERPVFISGPNDLNHRIDIKLKSGDDFDPPGNVNPSEGAVLANKCGDDDPTWNFEWDPVPGATGYHIRMRDNDGNIKFEETVTETQYSYTLTETVSESKLEGWFWKVSAEPDGPPVNVNFDVSSCETQSEPNVYFGNYSTNGTITEYGYCEWDVDWDGDATITVGPDNIADTVVNWRLDVTATDLDPNDPYACASFEQEGNYFNSQVANSVIGDQRVSIGGPDFESVFIFTWLANFNGDSWEMSLDIDGIPPYVGSVDTVFELEKVEP